MSTIWSNLEHSASVASIAEEDNETGSHLSIIRAAVQSKTPLGPLPPLLLQSTPPLNQLWGNTWSRYAAGEFALPQEAIFCGALLVLDGLPALLYSLPRVERLFMIINDAPLSCLEVDLWDRAKPHPLLKDDLLHDPTAQRSTNLNQMPPFFLAHQQPYHLLRNGPIPFLACFPPVLESDLTPWLRVSRAPLPSTPTELVTVFQRGAVPVAAPPAALTTAEACIQANELMDQLQRFVLRVATTGPTTTPTALRPISSDNGPTVPSPSWPPTRATLSPKPVPALLPAPLVDRRIQTIKDLNASGPLTSKHLSTCTEGPFRAACALAREVLSEEDANQVVAKIIMEFSNDEDQEPSFMDTLTFVAAQIHETCGLVVAETCTSVGALSRLQLGRDLIDVDGARRLLRCSKSSMVIVDVHGSLSVRMAALDDFPSVPLQIRHTAAAAKECVACAPPVEYVQEAVTTAIASLKAAAEEEATTRMAAWREALHGLPAAVVEALASREAASKEEEQEEEQKEEQKEPENDRIIQTLKRLKTSVDLYTRARQERQ